MQCCKAFAKMTKDGSSGIPQFEQDANGTWNINGCCGGGCYVVTSMRWCPFCGALIAEEPKAKKK